MYSVPHIVLRPSTCIFVNQVMDHKFQAKISQLSTYFSLLSCGFDLYAYTLLIVCPGVDGSSLFASSKISADLPW